MTSCVEYSQLVKCMQKRFVGAGGVDDDGPALMSQHVKCCHFVQPFFCVTCYSAKFGVFAVA